MERTSVWLFTPDRSKLECRSLFRRSLGRQMAGAQLDVSAFPAYFGALEQNRALDVTDAQNDARTRELTDGYLVPLGITSMLEATVRMDTGELVGVACHEHVGPIREWVLDEKSFAASIADMVTRALTDDRRRRLSAALAHSEERYRTYVSISTIGAAIFPVHGDNASRLLRCADIAMYEAKRKRLRAQLYSPALDCYSPRRLAIATSLGEAIRCGQVNVHYQPIVSLRERRVDSVEALARWRHPEYGMIAPDEFIPIAEMGDQIRDLTLYVLNESVRQWRSWGDAGLSTTVSINLSTRVLMDKSFVIDVRHILQTHDVPGANVHFEITESAMLTDPARAVETITALNSLDICFSVDDFGIGFSSLSSLKQLPLASLKIDRSFISQMPASERDASIVRSTIRLAHDLGLKVVAEGVEAADSLAMIMRMGCDQAQGFAITRPAEGSAILDWARSNGWS